jgi:hypothetical protein
MKNEELMTRRGSRLNPFTTALRDACLANTKVLVRMRNGNWQEVVFEAPEGQHPHDDCPDGGFRTPESSMYWLANGESITSNCFDLVDFEAPAPAVGEEPSPSGDVEKLVGEVTEYVTEHWAEHIPHGFGVPVHHHHVIEDAIRSASNEYLATKNLG